MPFDVIYDPDKQIGALIDPDHGRALGPLVSADKDRVSSLFETFVGAIGKDPADTHVIDLDNDWRGFLAAVADEGGEHEGETTTSATPAAAGSAGAEAAPPGAQPAGGQVAGDVSGAALAEQAPVGSTGGVAGPAPGEGHPAQSAPATGEPLPTGQPATGGLPPSHEQAPPAPDQPGGAGTSGGAGEGGGVPLAPPA